MRQHKLTTFRVSISWYRRNVGYENVDFRVFDVWQFGTGDTSRFVDLHDCEYILDIIETLTSNFQSMLGWNLDGLP